MEWLILANGTYGKQGFQATTRVHELQWQINSKTVIFPPPLFCTVLAWRQSTKERKKKLCWKWRWIVVHLTPLTVRRKAKNANRHDICMNVVAMKIKLNTISIILKTETFDCCWFCKSGLLSIFRVKHLNLNIIKPFMGFIFSLFEAFNRTNAHFQISAILLRQRCLRLNFTRCHSTQCILNHFRI